MIESTLLPPEATDYLNTVEGEDQRRQKEIDLIGAKKELHSHCLSFIKKSEAWRRASYEDKWLQYQRAADDIFDPDIATKKKAWQSKVHVPITSSHRENIHAHIFRTMVGVNPPLEVSPRYDLGEADQSMNIRDITLREMDKAKWGVVFDSVFNDADTFGSGFLRINYKTTIEKRKLRKETTEKFRDNLNPRGMVGWALRAATGKLRKEYEFREEDVLVYRGIELKHCSIWDIFPDPKALKIPGTTIAYRYYATHEDIVKGAEEGYYLPEAVEELRVNKADRRYDSGEDNVQADRGVGDHAADKTEFQQEHKLYEVFGRMPKKWIYSIIGEAYENGEELCPARVIFHEKCLVAVEINDSYDGEPPIYKLDYLSRNGSFYGIGVPQMLTGPQAVINEVVNQRLDNGAQTLNHSFAVLEKALVNPKQDLESAPGQVIRLNGTYVPNGDVRNAITQLQVSDTPVRAGFTEVNEAERWAQERTSANRVTLGTAGLVKDSNQTLGGQQLLKESAGEKFAYIGLKIELDFMQSFFQGIWKVLYANITPEDVEDSIGPDRARDFILITPEEMSRDYIYKPMGVFTMQNKAMRQAQIMQIRQAFLGAPWTDDEKFFDASFHNIDEDPDKFKKSEDQIMADQAGMVQPGMEGEPIGMPPRGMPPIPPTDTVGQPMPQI